MPASPPIPPIAIPNEMLERAVTAVIASLGIEQLELVTAKQAARLFKITPQGFRDLAKKEVGLIDLGPRAARYSVAELKAIVEKRRVKVSKKK